MSPETSSLVRKLDVRISHKDIPIAAELPIKFLHNSEVSSTNTLCTVASEHTRKSDDQWAGYQKIRRQEQE